MGGKGGVPMRTMDSVLGTRSWLDAVAIICLWRTVHIER